MIGRRRGTTLGRTGLLAVVIAAAVLLGGTVVARPSVLAGDGRPDAVDTAVTRSAAPKPFTPQPGRYYLTDAEIAQLRRTVKRAPWAKAAWARTKAAADAALAEAPNPAPSSGADYSSSGRDANNQCPNPPTGWFCLLYARGIHDGQNALNLARAFAITHNPAYATKAKQFLLAWARTYNPPNPTVAQDIADSGGFMLKGFLAYDLVRQEFTPAERTEFQAWAKLFVAAGEARADTQVDLPGIPPQTYNGDTSNWQSWGNSEAFARALAVAAAAVVGGDTLKAALAWNWQHTTRGGRSNGWQDLIDGETIDGTGGETFEGRARNDISYGLLGSDALLVIADIAKHAGYSRNLFTFTTPHGNSVLLPFRFYGTFLSGTSPWPQSDGSYANRDVRSSGFRAGLEIGADNAGSALKPFLKRVVGTAGPGQRASNFDPYVWLYGAVTATS